MPFVRRFGILILGTAFVVVGVGGAVALYPRPSSGWSAFAPLTAATFVAAPNVLNYGLGLAVIGLVLVSGWVGHQLGRRGTARPR